MRSWRRSPSVRAVTLAYVPAVPNADRVTRAYSPSRLLSMPMANGFRDPLDLLRMCHGERRGTPRGA